MHPTKRYAIRPLSGVQWIAIHHVGASVRWESSEVEAAKAVAVHHVKTNDWPGAGYTLYIGRNGGVYQLNDFDAMCYNVASLNHLVFGIVFEGDFTVEWPTEAQLVSGNRVIRWLGPQIPQAEVGAHKEIALPQYATACCGDTWDQWKGLLC